MRFTAIIFVGIVSHAMIASADEYTIGLYVDRAGTIQYAEYATQKPITTYLIVKGDAPFALTGWEAAFVPDKNVLIGVDEYFYADSIDDAASQARVALDPPIYSDHANQTVLARCTILAVVQGGVDLVGTDGPDSLPRMTVLDEDSPVSVVPDRRTERHCLTIHGRTREDPLSGYRTRIESPNGLVIRDLARLDPPYELLVSSDYDTLYINGAPYIGRPQLGRVIKPARFRRLTLRDWGDALRLAGEPITVTITSSPGSGSGTKFVIPYGAIQKSESITIDRIARLQLARRESVMRDHVVQLRDQMSNGSLVLFHSSSNRRQHMLMESGAGRLYLQLLDELHSEPDSGVEKLEAFEARHSFRAPAWWTELVQEP